MFCFLLDGLSLGGGGYLPENVSCFSTACFIFLSREEPGISIFKVFLAWLSYISLLKVELWKFFTLWTEFQERRGL